MADTTTTNLAFVKPEIGGSTDTWGEKLNDNLDALDGIFKGDGTGTSVGLNVGSGKILSVTGNGVFGHTASLFSGALEHYGSSTIFKRSSADASGHTLALLKTRGTTPAATTVVQNNDSLGSISYQGYDGTNNIVAALVSANVDGTPSAGVVPGRLSLGVRTAAGVLTSNMILYSNGQAAINAAGSESAPSLTKVGNLDTGIFFPSDNILAIATGGAERVRVSSSGVAITGALTATGNITANFSDERLKTKLGDIESALDKICAIETFYYEANETAQALGYEAKREIGVSAQSVQRVFPELVAPAPVDAKYLTVYYERLVAPIIAGIKELRAEVKALKGE